MRRSRGAIRRATRELRRARFITGPHKTAVAAERRQFVGKRACQFFGDCGSGAAQRRQSLPRDPAARLIECSEPRRKFGRGKNAVTDGGEIARAAAADHDACQGAGQIGHRLEFGAEVARRGASVASAATASSRCAISAGSVSGAASRCANKREPAAVTVRSIAARSEPRRSPPSVRMSSRFCGSPDRFAVSRRPLHASVATVAGVCRFACARHK